MKKPISYLAEIKFLAFLIPVLFFYSCNEFKPSMEETSSDSEILPKAYVSYATQGNILSNSSLKILFTADIELIKDGGDIINEDIFKFNPEIKGKIYWNSPSSIVFQPDSPLKTGENYEATADLSKLFKMEKSQDNLFKFTFGVAPLKLSLTQNTLEPYSPNNTELNFLTGKFAASDIVDLNKLKDVLTAKQGQKDLEITFTETTNETVFDYRVENIVRSEKDEEVILKWDGKSIDSEDKGETHIDVPALGKFELSKIKVINNPTQHIEITFSDPIDENINPNGIVYLLDHPDAKTNIESNKIFIYPTNRQTGDAVVVINKEIKNNKGVNLETNLKKNIRFGQLAPAVRFTDDGVVLPGKENWLLHFEAVNLSKVDIIIHKIFANNVNQFMQVNNLNGNYQLNRVSNIIHKQQLDLIPNKESNDGEWSTYAIDISKMIKEDKRGIYRVQIKFKHSYSLYDCENQADVTDETEDFRENNYYENEYYYPDNFRWNQQDDPCSNSYYYYDRFIVKNIMASNIGLTVKGNGNGPLTVFSTDLETTEPIVGLKLSILNYQNQIINEIKTDENGSAIISDKDPWMIVASRGDEFAYVKISGGNSLSYSRFDTKGVQLKNGLKSFIYGDRDVWRPGDTLFLTLMLNDNKESIPENHPATIKLFNPKNKLITKQTLLKNVNGIYAFTIKTSPDDLTGVWYARIEYGGSKFNKRIRIENLKPNRLKILLSFDNETLKQGNNKAKLNVKWLHGGIPSNLKSVVNATLRSIKTKFKDYEDFNFDDRGRYFEPEELVVLDSELNDKGNISFNINLPESYRAPGKLKVNFVTRVFEKGGDFSIDQISKTYSPFSTYVGLKSPKADNGSSYLEVDKKHRFDVVTLDSEGKAISVKNLSVEIYKIDWSWWYGSGGNGSSRYIQTNYNNKVFSTNINSVNGKAHFDFEISYPMWGRYYVKVMDTEGRHSTGSIIYLDWPSWYNRESRTAPGDASILSLTTDKKKYIVGDTVKISLPSPANSKIMLSMERNDRLIETRRQNSSAEESVVKFVATAEMTPNIYAYISVIQPFGKNNNDLPIRMYGVVPILVEDPLTVLKPVLKVPESIRPNSKYKIKVSEENNKKMTYTIAVVDEGLLDLTRFKTPEPHKAFYAKEALFMKTWDMYDYVMSAFMGDLKQTFAIGGSDEENNESPEKKKANRFKPVVSFIGPFTLEAGKTAEHEMLMTNYVGSVRFMIIAGNQGSYGHSENTVPVKQPLMVLATMPRVLAPSESIKLPISVFVLDENIKEVNVKLIPNDNFKCQTTEKLMKVEKVGEHNIFFDVDVNDFEGVGVMKVEVKSGDETAFHQIEIQIRNPNPRVFNVNHFKVDKNDDLRFTPEFKGIEGSNELVISVSSMPQINLEKRLKYLVSYPYGCIEQTTSSAFPQLFLSEFTDLSEKRKKQIETNISLAISRISKMQLNDGGFSYWPGRNTSNNWGTSYAGHFLIKAKEKGYNISHSLLQNWKNYQKSAANNWSPEYSSNGMMYNDLTQAYRIFTLALSGDANMGAMNRMLEMKGLNGISQYLLAGAYSLVGQNGLATELANVATYEVPLRNYWRNNYGSQTRDKAMIIEVLNLVGDEDAIPLVMELAEQLRSNIWMSTQTTAFSLNAMALYTKSNDKNDAYSFKYKWGDFKSDEIIPVKPISNHSLDVENGKKLKIENTSTTDIFVSVTTSGIPPLGKIIEEQNNLKLEVVYKTMDGKTIDVSNLKHGLDFYAEITIINPGKFGPLDNLALTQIFPSGWEIVNTRMFDIGEELRSDNADYVDFRDDRVNFFFGLNSGNKKKFIVLLNAAYKGKYFLPATQCSEMYNNNVKAVVGGGWIIVD
jgi:hypothetical protein